MCLCVSLCGILSLHKNTRTFINVTNKLPQIEINDRRVDKRKIFYKQQMLLKIILNRIINKSGGVLTESNGGYRNNNNGGSMLK